MGLAVVLLTGGLAFLIAGPLAPKSDGGGVSIRPSTVTPTDEVPAPAVVVQPSPEPALVATPGPAISGSATLATAPGSTGSLAVTANPRTSVGQAAVPTAGTTGRRPPTPSPVPAATAAAPLPTAGPECLIALANLTCISLSLHLAI